ncbi:Long chain acyl-CoA synthetase 7 peroxisomal [Phytophthora pseudosyringae]|uniref:Long chain acyl-CoA synthetase 7 peroxisomal n=1 Tax=Phytophthora pseudosyringae TaxID=221518 RepID=A0A8T1WDA8_9STRA|nr:Long chain acyl-CoA synthetase 7 peroxisomal [Phytophthora pseudosyringae]
MVPLASAASSDRIRAKSSVEIEPRALLLAVARRAQARRLSDGLPAPTLANPRSKQHHAASAALVPHRQLHRRLAPRWLRSLSTSSRVASVSYTHELRTEPRTAGRGPARVCPVETLYKPHMTLYTNLLDRAKVDDGSRPMFGSRPVDPATGVATGDYE